MAMFLTTMKALTFNSYIPNRNRHNRTVGLEFLNNAILDFLLVQHGIIEFQNHPI